MSKFKKKKSGDLPAISTASLPDIVFMLLFFFMTATTMKDSDLKIENRLPKADQTAKLHKKQYVMYVYAGKAKETYRSSLGSSDRIQLNDKISSVGDIRNFVFTERASR
jgi:biopolymer transport protein ExbD